MTEGILRAFFGAFFGALGFAMLIHAPRKSWLLSGLIAGLSYLLYWVMTYFGISDNLAVFCGALFGSVSGQICARRAKMIGTVFLISAIVPVVPGLGLYRMMELLGQGRNGPGISQGVQAIITIAMIVLGVSMGSLVCRLAEIKRYHKGSRA